MNSVTPKAAAATTSDIVMVAAVMRSGQTWLCYMLAHALNARFIEPYCLLRGIVYTGSSYVRELADGNLPDRAPMNYSLVVKTHACPDPHFSLTRKLVLLVRDPRDTITSAALRFHVMTTTGSDVEEDAQELSLLEEPVQKPMTFKERASRLIYGNRLLAITMTARKWRAFYNAWPQIPFCHVVRYEELLRQPVATMAGICRYLEVELTESQLFDTVQKLSMKEIASRQTKTDPKRNIGFRKGIIGDFKNHLSFVELAIVRHYCKETASRFGYEL